MGRHKKNHLVPIIEIATDKTVLPKYKIMIITEKDLVDELTKQDSDGYELTMFLDTILPDVYDDNKKFKILFKR